MSLPNTTSASRGIDYPRGLSGREMVLLSIAHPGFRSFACGELYFTLGWVPSAF